MDDIGRGVISPALVKWLIKKAPKAEWFLSSKGWRPAREPDVPEEQPDWLQELERTNAENVKLLLVPHKAAARAVDEGDLSCWIDCGGPSMEAVKRLDQLRQRFPKATIVVMPKGLTVLARLVNEPVNKKEHDQCLVQTNKDGRTIDDVGGDWVSRSRPSSSLPLSFTC